MSISQNLEELKTLNQWVNYIRIWNATKKDGRGGYDKPPINPFTLRDARNIDPAHWTTYDQAAGNIGKTATHRDTKHRDDQGDAPIIRKPVEGVGLIVAGGYCGVDLDDVIDEKGNLAPFAAAIVDRLDTYTEISPSGKGLHLILYCGDFLEAAKVAELEKYLNLLAAGLTKEEATKRAKGAGNFGKQFTLDAAGEITDEAGKVYELEIYFYIRGGRYLTVTGNTYRDRPINRTKAAEVQAIIDEYTAKKDAYRAARRPAIAVESSYKNARPATDDDDKRMVESALAAVIPGDLIGYDEWAPIMSALYEMGYLLDYAEAWSSGRLSGTVNPINNPVSNERRWNRGNFRLKDPANAAGIIINAAKRFGWTPADAFDDETRAAYGRSLYTEEERREYGRRLHEERVDNWWNDQATNFRSWKKNRKKG